MKPILVSVIFFSFFFFNLLTFNYALAIKNEQITFDLPKDNSYTRNNPISVVNSKFQIGNIKASLLTSINSTEYDMAKSNITFDYSFKDYGYKRKWIINATNPLLSAVSIDYFKFSMEGCDYYQEYVFHCGKIELDFQDLVDSGYGVSIVNNSIIVRSNAFNTLKKIYLDPTDQFLPNSTNKAYLISSTHTYNPSLAVTEFTSTQYANVNTSNNVYATSTAQAETCSGSCGGICGTIDCLEGGGICVISCPDSTSGSCSGSSSCTPPSAMGSCSVSCDCGYSSGCSVCTRLRCKLTGTCSITGSCTGCTCSNGYYDTDQSCANGCEASVYSGIYTFQRFSFNMSNYTSGMDNATFCWEGKYSSTGGSSSGRLLWYNITDSKWYNSTATSTSESTYCLYFGTNMTDLFNSTIYYANFSAMGNQSRTGHLLTLSSDYAYINVSWTEFIPTTTTTTSTTTTTTSTTSTTTTIQPIVLPIEDVRILCFTQLHFSSDNAKLYLCDLMDYIECYLSLPITNKLLRLTLCVSQY